jgi:Uma2 family endonuclease
MSTARPLSADWMNEADYLVAEQQATERHEYVNGRVYAMAGASKRHNRIAGNIYRAVMVAGSPCTAYISDMKVHSNKYHSYYYPDVVVGCDSNETDEYVLENPCLIVEVTSDSTLRKDYLEKSLAYQAISSVQAYLIVAQDKVQVDMLTRASDGSWELQQFNELDAELNLSCPLMMLSVAAIYAGLEV